MSGWVKQPKEFNYTLIGFSDMIRFSKTNKKKGFSMYAIANDPFNETKLTGLSSDGTMYARPSIFLLNNFFLKLDVGL